MILKIKDNNNLKVPFYKKHLSASNQNKEQRKIKLVKNKKFFPIRDKTEKGKLDYSECSTNSLKKINFRKNSNYLLSEYKGLCFACDVGCSVSRTGYSQMNYSPYNNSIKRRDFTPIKN